MRLNISGRLTLVSNLGKFELSILFLLVITSINFCLYFITFVFQL